MKTSIRFRSRPHTTYFVSHSLTTTALLFYVYEFDIVGVIALPKTVSFKENLLLVSALASAAFFVRRVREKARRDSRTTNEPGTR